LNLKSADVVRKIISRYLSVAFLNGFMNIRIRESEEKYFNNIIELKNFSNHVCTFQIHLHSYKVYVGKGRAMLFHLLCPVVY